MAERISGVWANLQNIGAKEYRCGYCDAFVSSTLGMQIVNPQAANMVVGTIRVCPNCQRPTFFEGNRQQPGVAFGGKVDHIPSDVDCLYQEARKCTSAGAHTAAILACRKILMHTAVNKGAEPGKSFLEYVEFLAQKGYITADAKGWVDAIRTKGNEANHEIKLMNQEDAEDLLTLVEMLLKIIYEFPARAPKPPASA
jgi:hypothetical protein